MTVESPANLEQDPAQIEEIRDCLRDLYDLPEVKDAVWEHFSGQVDEYDMGRFIRGGTVAVRRPDFIYAFYPRTKSEGLNEKYRKLSLGRYRQGAGLEGSLLIDASSPFRIRVVEYSSWPTDPNKNIEDDSENYIDGQRAIDIAREVITSFNQQSLPLSSQS